MDNKTCTKCGECKPHSDFYMRADFPSIPRNVCKICWLAQSRERGQTPEGKAAKRKVYERDKAVPGRIRQLRLLHKYGITPEDFSAMLGEQRCLCKICKRPLSLIPYKADSCCIDHDHDKRKGEPGFVRGLLCLVCNRTLGEVELAGGPDRFASYLLAVG